jgi:AraC-like DNA-binding protein
MRDPAPIDIQSVRHERVAAPSVRKSVKPPTSGWLLVYTLSGTGQCRHGELWLDTGPAELVLLRRDREVGLRATGEHEWEFLRARFGDERRWAPPTGLTDLGNGHLRATIDPQVRDRVADAALRAAADFQRLEDATTLSSVGPGLADRVRAVGQLRELVRNGLREILLLATHLTYPPHRLDPRVRAAIALMEGDLAHRYTLASLARATHMSPSRLNHLFIRDTGLPPIATLQSMRLRQAARRLRETDEAVGAIGVDLGFGSLFHFSRQFRRHYGVSPRAYRMGYQV